MLVVLWINGGNYNIKSTSKLTTVSPFLWTFIGLCCVFYGLKRICPEEAGHTCWNTMVLYLQKDHLKTGKFSLLSCYPMCKHSTIWSLQGWKIIEPMICHCIDGTPLVIVDCHSMVLVWSRSITMLALLPSLFMQFAKINNHEDSLSFSNLQKNIDRIKRLRLSGFFVHHSFVLIELVSGKNVFHEGVFSKPRNNWPDTVTCSMKLDRAAHGTLALFANLESCAKRVILERGWCWW